MDYTRQWEAPPPAPAPVPYPSAAHAPPAHNHLNPLPYHHHHPQPQPHHHYSSYPAADYPHPNPNPNPNPAANPDHPPPADPYYYHHHHHHHHHQQQDPYSVPHSSSYLPASYAYPNPSPAPAAAPAPIAATKPDNAFTSVPPAPAPPADSYHYPPPPPLQTQSLSHSQPSYLASHPYPNPTPIPAAKPAPSSTYVPPPDPYALDPNARGYEGLRHHAGATYTDPGMDHHHHAGGPYSDPGLNRHRAYEGRHHTGAPYGDPRLNYHHPYVGHHHAGAPYSDSLPGLAAAAPYSDRGLRPVTPPPSDYYNTARGGEGGGYAVSGGVTEAIRQYGVDPHRYEQTPTLVSNPLDPVLSSNPIPTHWNNMTYPASKEATRKNPKRAKMMGTAYCQVCKIECNSTDSLKTHKQGKKHKKNLLKLQEAITAKPAKAPATAKVKKEKESLRTKDKAASEQRKKRAAADTPAATDDELEMKKKVVLDGGAAPDEIRVCTICNVVVNSQQVFEFHIAGQKHAAMVKKQQEAVQVS